MRSKIKIKKSLNSGRFLRSAFAIPCCSFTCASKCCVYIRVGMWPFWFFLSESKLLFGFFGPFLNVKDNSFSQSKGGQLLLSAGHIGIIIVSRGPKSGQICFFKAKNEAIAGRMWPAGRMLLPPVIEACFGELWIF